LRILHTADWHLGHRLYDRDRTPEHRAALAWLLDTVEEEGIDVLIVAGDVFDVANPSNQARELYYEFLGQLARTKCLAAVVVGGNHDSPAMLDAPKEVLKWLNLHVVGSARTQVQEEVVSIAMPGKDGPSIIIAAVPYLRERDIRKAKFGETSEERLVGLQQGISGHYREVAEAAEALRQNPETPIIATGHLFAGGASDHEEKKSYIYQADEHNIEGGQFPEVFDYVALGHIHRAQRVGGAEHIRYCGSLVPLTFVEGQQVRSVRIVEIGKAGAPITSRQVNVPYFRTLLRLNAEVDEVKQALRTAAVAHQNQGDTPTTSKVRQPNQESNIENRESSISSTSKVRQPNQESNIENRESSISSTSKVRQPNQESNIENREPSISSTSKVRQPNQESNIENRESSISSTSKVRQPNQESNIENRESSISSTSNARQPNQESNIENRESSISSTSNTSPLPRRGAGGEGLTPWAEIRVKTDEHIPNLRQTLLDVLAEVTEADGPHPPVELLRISQERLTPAPAAAPLEKKQLDELDPEEVFSGIIMADGYTTERATELMADFRNLRNWMNDTAE
jgi:exonuclease SbcD